MAYEDEKYIQAKDYMGKGFVEVADGYCSANENNWDRDCVVYQIPEPILRIFLDYRRVDGMDWFVVTLGNEYDTRRSAVIGEGPKLDTLISPQYLGTFGIQWVDWGYRRGGVLRTAIDPILEASEKAFSELPCDDAEGDGSETAPDTTSAEEW